MSLPGNILGLAALTGTANQMIKIHDDYVINSNSLVVFTCPAKGTGAFSSKTPGGPSRPVTGILSEGINLSAVAEWKNFISGIPAGGNLVDMFNMGGQLLFGVSIYQPWFSRKYWAKTDPLKMDIPMEFMTFYNAKSEVWDACLTLISYLYPRYKVGVGDLLTDPTNENPTPLQKLSTNIVNAINPEGKGSDLNSLFGAYYMPGPHLFYSGRRDDNKGDFVTVHVGNNIVFKACYITKVSVSFSTAMDIDGYPLSAKVVVSVESMEANVVDSNGEFNTHSLGNNAGVTSIDFSQLESTSAS